MPLSTSFWSHLQRTPVTPLKAWTAKLSQPGQGGQAPCSSFLFEWPPGHLLQMMICTQSSQNTTGDAQPTHQSQAGWVWPLRPAAQWCIVVSQWQSHCVHPRERKNHSMWTARTVRPIQRFGSNAISRKNKRWTTPRPTHTPTRFGRTIFPWLKTGNHRISHTFSIPICWLWTQQRFKMALFRDHACVFMSIFSGHKTHNTVTASHRIKNQDRHNSKFAQCTVFNTFGVFHVCSCLPIRMATLMLTIPCWWGGVPNAWWHDGADCIQRNRLNNRYNTQT